MAAGAFAQTASDRATPRSQNYPSQPNSGASSVRATAAPATAEVAVEPVSRVSQPAAAGEGLSSRFNSNLYTVEKTLLSSTQVGSPYQYRLRVNALADITNIHVTEHLPEGLELVSTEPAATVRGRDLEWSWPSQAQGESRDLLVTVTPRQEGNFVTSSKVCVDPVVVLPLFAGTPRLELVKTALQTVELGEEVPFRITVTNTGTATARNVVVTDTLPEGITSSSDLSFTVGDLAPGQSRELTVVGKVEKGGSLVNIASATFDGGQPVQVQAPLTVVESRLGISKTGGEQSYIFKEVPYQIVVTNQGNTTISNVVVTDEIPSGTEVVSSTPEGRTSRGRLTWEIPSLAAGQSESYSVVLTTTKPDRTVNVATATGTAATGKKLSARGEAVTNWEGAPGVLTEIVDTRDPIRIGQNTTYEIRITNSGSHKPVNGQFKITLSRHLRPVSTSGDSQGTIEGQVVTFPDVLLNPRGVTRLRVEAEGIASGSGRARLEFNSSFLDEPVIKDESTFVY